LENVCAGMHVRTHAQTDEQVENRMPTAAHQIGGGGIIIIIIIIIVM